MKIYKVCPTLVNLQANIIRPKCETPEEEDGEEIDQELHEFTQPDELKHFLEID